VSESATVPAPADRPGVSPGDPVPAGFRLTWPTIARPWLLVPTLAIVLVFFALPFVLNAGFAFSNWSGFSDEVSYTGLDNFRTLVDQELLVNAIRVTVLYALCAMLVQNLVSLPLALALVDTTALNSFFRSLFFLPVLISPLAAGYIWGGLLDPAGPINSFLDLFIPGHFDHAWLGEASTALPAVAFVDAWKWSGLTTLVYIAGLKAIPTDLVRAATVDGASAWSRFWRIKFPLLAPALTFNVAVTLVGALSAYDVIQATTAGGPGDHTTALNVAMRQQWGQGLFGTASALSLTVTVLVVLTAVPLVAWLRSRETT
jgi:raffinose/stachyose/melibiose transport system permease protein